MKLTVPLLALSVATTPALAFPLLSWDYLSGLVQNPLSVSRLPGYEKPIPGDSPVNLCDLDQPKLAEIYRLDVTPNPPEKGKNVTIYAEGIAKKTIKEGAYVDVEVRYGYIKLLEQTFDLCEQSKSVGIECPIEKGKVIVNSTAAIPIEVPPGKYSVAARAYTVDDEPITCLSATVLFQ
ncbi:hypothetical protein D0Z00_001840 [Geotrichum galactomycetum]|uniref:Uncharacterized protein n=1 Tax=Geotrichum galactomycetum TaxID=27317 RepID=A0ACB6V5U8_9ASCO|nr:hypothetical protein D0Z00_001840 [Geotrichum candidum]